MKIKSILPIVLACILIAPRLSMASTDTIYGKFSISPTQQIHFASGNLQYQSTTKIWRFAEHQWDYIGSYGYYWSSTVYSNLDSCGVFFDNCSLLPQSVLLKEYGFSVRLVCPAE